MLKLPIVFHCEDDTVKILEYMEFPQYSPEK